MVVVSSDDNFLSKPNLSARDLNDVDFLSVGRS